MENSQIPFHLPEFKTPTLLFVSDTTRAKWYLLNGKDISKVGGFERKKPVYSDDTRHNNIDEIEINELEHFSKDAAEALMRETKAAGAKHVIVCVPQRIKSFFDKHIPAPFKKKIIRHHDANLYRFAGLEVLKMLYK